MISLALVVLAIWFPHVVRSTRATAPQLELIYVFSATGLIAEAALRRTQKLSRAFYILGIGEMVAASVTVFFGISAGILVFILSCLTSSSFALIWGRHDT
jgi:hypothetical protein